MAGRGQGWLKTNRTAASLLGVPLVQFDRWEAEGRLPPRDGEGYWEQETLRNAVRSLQSGELLPLTAAASAEGTTYHEARTALKWEQHRKLKRENDLEEKKVVLKSEVEQLIVGILYTLRGDILAFPAEQAPVLASDSGMKTYEAQTLLQRLTDGLLEKLARTFATGS